MRLEHEKAVMKWQEQEAKQQQQQGKVVLILNSLFFSLTKELNEPVISNLTHVATMSILSKKEK